MISQETIWCHISAGVLNLFGLVYPLAIKRSAIYPHWAMTKKKKGLHLGGRLKFLPDFPDFMVFPKRDRGHVIGWHPIYPQLMWTRSWKKTKNFCYYSVWRILQMVLIFFVKFTMLWLVWFGPTYCMRNPNWWCFTYVWNWHWICRLREICF